VETLLMLDTNPAYSAPPEFDFAVRLGRVTRSITTSLYADETAESCTWQIPLAHEYEAWGDARAFDGTATIQQPQVRRLYGGHAASEVLALFQGNPNPSDETLVREFWQAEAQGKGRGDFAASWHEALRSGVVPDTAAAAIAATPKADLASGVSAAAPAAPDNGMDM